MQYGDNNLVTYNYYYFCICFSLVYFKWFFFYYFTALFLGTLNFWSLSLPYYFTSHFETHFTKISCFCLRGLTLNSEKKNSKKMLTVVLYQLLIFVSVVRIVSLKVNTPISPPRKKGRGMVEGLEEWGGILRTHKALQREVFFSNA